MYSWKPITDEEFTALFAEQYGELDSEERYVLERYRVSPWKAIIRRTEQAGDEHVFVVAQTTGGVLYYDDVENGFNVSCIDNSGRLTTPGCSQYTLQEAVNRWFPMRERNR
jgi:hypothetical protein